MVPEQLEELIVVPLWMGPVHLPPSLIRPALPALVQLLARTRCRVLERVLTRPLEGLVPRQRGLVVLVLPILALVLTRSWEQQESLRRSSYHVR